MDERAAVVVKPALETLTRKSRGMTADHLQGIEKFEADLWKIADNLRANSNLASNEYFMPIMGLIFLRHATNRFYEAKAGIEADKAAGKMPDRPLVEADFTRRRALNLPESARFDVILKTPKDGNLGTALNAAMEAIEAAFPPLAGQLPKDYARFEGGVLEEMMRVFDSEGLRTASGDVFGRIYEYFLAEFSKQGAHTTASSSRRRRSSRPLSTSSSPITGRVGSRQADRASNDADVSSILPIIPYGGFSPVRLEGWLIRRSLPVRRSAQACSRHTLVIVQFASVLRALRGPHRWHRSESGLRARWRTAMRRSAPPTPGALAQVRVVVSRSVIT